MTAKELDTMTRAMRDCGHAIKNRTEAEEPVYMLCKGLRAIGRDDLVSELWKLYDEMENVDSSDICKEGTFR